MTILHSIKYYFSYWIIFCGFSLIIQGCSPIVHEKTTWKASAERQEQVVDVTFTSHQLTLNAQQKQQLKMAKQRSNLSTPYYGEIEVIPTMATDSKQIQSIHHHLVALGLPAGNIKILKTLSDADNPGFVRIHIIQYQAMAPNCPGWTEAMTSDVLRYNVGPEGETHFNCTTQANLARMVSNPKDLIDPATLDYGDGAYLSKTITDLNRGKIGQGDKSGSDASGLIGAASALAAPSPTTK